MHGDARVTPLLARGVRDALASRGTRTCPAPRGRSPPLAPPLRGVIPRSVRGLKRVPYLKRAASSAYSGRALAWQEADTMAGMGRPESGGHMARVERVIRAVTEHAASERAITGGQGPRWQAFNAMMGALDRHVAALARAASTETRVMQRGQAWQATAAVDLGEEAGTGRPAPRVTPRPRGGGLTKMGAAKRASAWMDTRHPGWSEALSDMDALVNRAGLSLSPAARPLWHLTVDELYHSVTNTPGCAA